MTTALYGDPFFPTGGGADSRYAGMPYSSPFATQGRAWTPMEVRYLFRSCRFYFLMNPLINAASTKMATYPITELLFESQDASLREMYETFFTDTVDLHTFLIELGLDYNVYGNAFAGVYFPFEKYLICRSCGKRTPAKQSKFDFSGGEFTLYCACGQSGKAEAEDKYYENERGVRLIRWNPEDFQIHYNEVTGECLYQWTMPHQLKHDILLGKKHVVPEVPQVFLEAVRKNKPIVFNKDKVIHLKRPSISSRVLGRAWGVPMILPVLEDVFYLQILRKAQEQIAAEHLVPLRVLFPQPSAGADQPFSFMNLSKWQEQVQEEILKYRRDRNYIPVLPVPLGNQTISGDGRALLLHQEIRIVSEHIISGMGVPVEFVFGGLSYSGSSLSMRMLENIMLNYRQEHLRFLRWLTRSVSAFLKWPSCEISLRDFRMADDLNRRQYLFNLHQAGLICDQDLLEESGFDAAEQKQKRKKEEKERYGEQERMLLAQTDAQNKAQKKQMMAQMELQQEMADQGMPMGPEAGMGGEMMQEAAGSPLSAEQGAVDAPVEGGAAQVDPRQVVQQIASRIAALPAADRMNEIARLRHENPAIAEEVARTLASAPMQQQVQPLPEQLPPRRGAEGAVL